MDARTRQLVQDRAGGRCEFCGMPEKAYPISFHVEHIVASVHQHIDDPDNLAWACPPCNAHKGPNLATIDPESGQQANLFNPRVDRWEDHFVMTEGVISGLTPVGRGTLQLLKMNRIQRVELRRAYRTA